LSAQITKLVLASACHMVASRSLFNNCLAILTLSEVQIVLKKVYFLLIAIPFVFFKVTLRAKLYFAISAYPRLILFNFDNPFTILFRTKF
jgi:hypothetical protein